MESNEKVEVNVEKLKKAMDELIKDQKYELVTDIATEVINNSNASVESRATMQAILMKLDALARDFDEGRSRALSILESEGLKTETRHKMIIKLITLEIADRNYDEAEKMAYDLLAEKGLRKEDEVKLKAQLITISIDKGDYKFATYRAIQLLKEDEISNKTRDIVISRLSRMNRIQGKYKEARNILKLYSSKRNIAEIVKYIEEIEPEAKKLELWEEEMKKNKETNVDDIQEEVAEPEEMPEIKQEVKLRQDGVISTVEINEVRASVYKGEIDMEQINSIAQDNKDTLIGCLFVAELCAYFDLQNLGSNCLKAYRKNNSNLKQYETRIVSKALELLKRNGLNGQRLKEEWNTIYEYLPTTQQDHKDVRVFIEENEDFDDEIELL